MMEDFASETDSDYTSYWRDWVGHAISVFNPSPARVGVASLRFCLTSLPFAHLTLPMPSFILDKLWNFCIEQDG